MRFDKTYVFAFSCSFVLPSPRVRRKDKHPAQHFPIRVGSCRTKPGKSFDSCRLVHAFHRHPLERLFWFSQIHGLWANLHRLSKIAGVMNKKFMTLELIRCEKMESLHRKILQWRASTGDSAAEATHLTLQGKTMPLIIWKFAVLHWPLWAQ